MSAATHRDADPSLSGGGENAEGQADCGADCENEVETHVILLCLKVVMLSPIGGFPG
jgi:hypothetical protein